MNGNHITTTSSATHINNPLDPPSAPFTHHSPISRDGSPAPFGSSDEGGPNGSRYPFKSPSREASQLSLTVNYLPKKFSSSMLNAGARKRKNAGKGDNSDVNLGPKMPKTGGGVEAFRSGEARIPGQHDEDDDATLMMAAAGAGRLQPKRKLKWNRFKWILFFSNLLFMIYSLIALIICLLTWFNVWEHADVVRVGNRTELIISTLAASTGIITSMIGWMGILLNNRSFLAVYTFLTWITFGLMVVPGYLSYKKRTFNLEGKINAQWSRDLGTAGRLRVQNELDCCGYFSPFVEATVSQTCYARSVLPGCKLRYMNFERKVLEKFYTASFALVPAQIWVMVVGLLCSNHVTYRFGKGMMPKAYRLSLNSMAVIMDQYASELAEQYGQDVASEIMARSKVTLPLDSAMPTMPYKEQSQQHQQQGGYHVKYDSIGARVPDTVG
ncbi:hypothetical protein AMATHDRAFT_71807 [Amanita thiersii Skay4041]|uniref:Tetraspanin Tsp2 n=1 Tax=Amanita thiersii Skay4041 TaxID=703135 RepID=A0A2A9NCB5_9AGAR|nr:hypothetical protein AMATHDRAFT_71807 [Amanita thiersii Skay4041]